MKLGARGLVMCCKMSHEKPEDVVNRINGEGAVARVRARSIQQYCLAQQYGSWAQEFKTLWEREEVISTSAR